MFTSIDYDAIVSWLSEKNQPVQIPTLGRRSIIRVRVINGQFHVTGSGGASKTFTRDYWQSICDIIDATVVNRRELTTNYNGNDVPDYVFAPSVPAICRQYCEELRNNAR